MMISFGPSPEEKLVVMIFKDCTHQGRIWFPVLFDVIQNIVKYLCSIIGAVFANRETGYWSLEVNPWMM